MRLTAALTQPLSFPLRVRSFLRKAGRLDRAEADLRDSIATRETRFLALLAQTQAPGSRSPYAKLLRHAGTTLEDVRELVHQEGLEGALRRLADAGVYLAASELKGKTDVTRGSLSFCLNPEDIRLSRDGFASQSSGTSNQPQRLTTSFEWLAQETPAVGTFILAHSLQTHRHAAFEPVLPGVAGMMYMLKLARLGIPCVRWFARAMPFSNRFEQAYFMIIAHELSLMGTLFGPGFARPQTTPEHQIDRIVRWIADCRAKGEKSCVRTVASNAARIARTGTAMGVSLEGVTFMASGEPMTEAKRSVIDASGARTTVLYGFEPGGVWVGQGCPTPLYGDEMHVSLNTLAVIHSPRLVAYGDAAVHPLLFTTLHPSASRFLLNAENGDYAQLAERDCGCVMQRAGLTLHIHAVRSYEKLTSEGLNFPIDDLIEIIERRLPAEFGGGPYDYQLVEEEGTGAQTMITLRIHPQVGVVDEAGVMARLIDELGRTDEKQRFMTEVWRQARSFNVQRVPPITSARGKTLAVRLAVGKES
ncbi:MAG: hypothetical protein H7Z74_14205 [Anaerolineae bacterium]|nr:hypothetical protein [Gemmatimonadaceae bacterium]